MYYVYLLRCQDDTLYCGYTDDLQKRLAAHNGGRGAKYTRSRLPVVIAYDERFGTKSEAMKRECQIKKLTRGEKLALIRERLTRPDGESGKKNLADYKNKLVTHR